MCVNISFMNSRKMLIFNSRNSSVDVSSMEWRLSLNSLSESVKNLLLLSNVVAAREREDVLS